MRWLYQLHCCFPSFPCLLGSVVLCCDRMAYCFHNCTSSNMLIPFVFCQLPTTLFQASVTTAIHATKITFCHLPTTWWYCNTPSLYIIDGFNSRLPFLRWFSSVCYGTVPFLNRTRGLWECNFSARDLALKTSKFYESQTTWISFSNLNL